MSRSKHSPEEKLQAVMESLDHNTTQAEVCRRYGIFPTQLSKWKQQFLEGVKDALSHNSMNSITRMKNGQSSEIDICP